MPAFDQGACIGTGLDDLMLEAYRQVDQWRVGAREAREGNNRTVEEQMASLGLFDLLRGCPTHAAVLAFGSDPLEWMPGAFLEVVHIAGVELTDPVLHSKRIGGNLITQLQQLDLLLPLGIRTARRPVEGLRHRDLPNYPLEAIRELAMNAVMHRRYDGTSLPVYVHWFENRVEILNPGGLYGQVTAENFGRRLSDCRNGVIAEIMKALGYVGRAGDGIARVRRALTANGNGEPEFRFEPGFTCVTVHSAA